MYLSYRPSCGARSVIVLRLDLPLVETTITACLNMRKAQRPGGESGRRSPNESPTQAVYLVARNVTETSRLAAMMTTKTRRFQSRPERSEASDIRMLIPLTRTNARQVMFRWTSHLRLLGVGRGVLVMSGRAMVSSTRSDRTVNDSARPSLRRQDTNSSCLWTLFTLIAMRIWRCL